jgi:mannose-6-phosphate isomerase-like protein (cupin superfamily)
MNALSGGAAVIGADELTETEGNRHFRMPVSRAMGARDIAQSVSAYSKGRSPARRNPTGEEVLYVVRGSGRCYIDNYAYELHSGTAVYIPPTSVYQIENLNDDPLEIISVCCPEDEQAEFDSEPAIKSSQADAPILTLLESEQKSIPVSDRAFKLMVNHSIGCKKVTQFIGVIPPGRAPMHHHTYEEAIYIIEGQGCVHTDEGRTEFAAGASIYLPRGVNHCLENTGTVNIKLLGVFHPSGSPGEAYEDEEVTE